MKTTCMNRISNQKLYQQVYEQLRNSIRNGEYRKGDPLPSEKELMDALGVSRVTVRQALGRLADAGIIKTHQGKGSVVAVDWKILLESDEMKEDAKKYWDQFELSTNARRVIEPAIAKQAALMATEENIQYLTYIHENDREQITRLGFQREDDPVFQSFHSCLWEILGNPMLKPVWDAIVAPSNYLRRLPIIPPVDMEAHHREVKRQHGDILEAVRRHDGDYAYFHMLHHTDWIYKTYKNYYNEFFDQV